MTVPEAPLYNMKTLTWYWGCKDHKEKQFLKYNKIDRTEHKGGEFGWQPKVTTKITKDSYFF